MTNLRIVCVSTGSVSVVFCSVRNFIKQLSAEEFFRHDDAARDALTRFCCAVGRACGMNLHACLVGCMLYLFCTLLGMLDFPKFIS